MYVNILVIGLDKLLYYYFPYSYGLLKFMINMIFGISYYTVIPISKVLYKSGRSIYKYSIKSSEN